MATLHVRECVAVRCTIDGGESGRDGEFRRNKEGSKRRGEQQEAVVAARVLPYKISESKSVCQCAVTYELRHVDFIRLANLSQTEMTIA